MSTALTPSHAVTPAAADAAPISRTAAPQVQHQAARSRRGAWQVGAWSEVGSYHPRNEDSYRHTPGMLNPAFIGVADGVGGGSHGDVASAALLDHCAAVPAKIGLEALKAAIRDSDAVVRQRLASRSDRPGAATFVGAWFVRPQRVRLCHVGDCCAFHLIPSKKGLRLERLTLDQTYANLNETPPPKGRPDDPARMVGVGAVGQVAVREVKLAPGEGLLLCSDGLHKFLPQAELQDLLQRGLAANLAEQDICQNLVRAAKRNGSHDDVTALLALRRPGLRPSVIWLAILLTLLAVLIVLDLATGSVWQAMLINTLATR